MLNPEFTKRVFEQNIKNPIEVHSFTFKSDHPIRTVWLEHQAVRGKINERLHAGERVNEDDPQMILGKKLDKQFKQWFKKRGVYEFLKIARRDLFPRINGRLNPWIGDERNAMNIPMHEALRNAFDHGHPKGEVRLSMWQTKEMLAMSVKNVIHGEAPTIQRLQNIHEAEQLLRAERHVSAEQFEKWKYGISELCLYRIEDDRRIGWKTGEPTDSRFRGKGTHNLVRSMRLEGWCHIDEKSHEVLIRQTRDQYTECMNEPTPEWVPAYRNQQDQGQSNVDQT